MRARNNRPFVSEVSKGQVRVERGDISSIADADRIALVAQFNTEAAQRRSLSEYLGALDRGGFLPVIISTAEVGGPLQFPHGIPRDTIVVRRPNLGYDFGSWATGLGVLPGVRTADVVLLTNDSMMGPFAPIDELLEWACEPGPDIRGLTGSHQITSHTQSYFLAFRGGILADDPWMRFFNSIRVESTKMDVVRRYELGLSRHADDHAYSMEEWVSDFELGVPYANPTMVAWKQLIEHGVPMVKRTVMTDPSTASERERVREYVREQFGVEIEEW